MVDLPAQSGPDEEEGPRTIVDGVFEQEFYVEPDAAGKFLIELGEQLQSGTRLTLMTQEWKIPFDFQGPIEFEIEFDADNGGELSIELELQGDKTTSPPEIS